MHGQRFNSTLAKQLHQQLVLHIIQGQGRVSRKEISEFTALNPAAEARTGCCAS